MEETDLPIIEDLPSNNTSYIYPDEVDANNEGNSAVDEQSSNTNVNAPIFNFLPIVVNVSDFSIEHNLNLDIICTYTVFIYLYINGVN